MPGAPCRIVGGAFAALLVLLAGQTADARDGTSGPATGSYDRSGDRQLHPAGVDDGLYIPPKPLFEGYDDDELLGGERGTNTDPDLYFTDEREEFLEDGGGITVPAQKLRTLTHRRAGRDRGWRDPRPPRTTHRTSGSFTIVYSDFGDRRHLPAVPASLGFGAPGPAQGPKIIDVARERLDRRAIPPSGIEVINAGGPKIIRIAQDYDRTTTASIGAAEQERAAVMEPWSPAWLSWCSRNHPSFDADFGTYRDAAGRNRFCTGD